MHLPGKHLLVEISRLPSILCLQDTIPLPVTQTVLETSGFHKNNLYIENLSAISVMFPLNLKDLIIYSIVSVEAHLHTPVLPYTAYLVVIFLVKQLPVCTEESPMNSNALFSTFPS